MGMNERKKKNTKQEWERNDNDIDKKHEIADCTLL